MSETNLNEIDPATLDSNYSPFPAFLEWKTTLDEERWDEVRAELAATRERLSEDALKAAVDFTLRTAAIDTGAIEGLYDVDRGFTFSVAMQAVTWDTETEERGADIQRLFEAQLTAYELVLNVVTRKTPVSEAWLRTLHKEICEPQDTYRVRTSVGWQDQPLPKGQYKKLPNHVIAPDGTSFSYAPVAMTAEEMKRLTTELRSEAFEAAHPVVQAAYSHYALARVHPFADGNGRVARALSSLYLLRAVSVPLIVFADQKDSYFASLSRADHGDYDDFSTLIFERAVDAMLIQIERLKAWRFPEVDKSTEALGALFDAYHGLRHSELDDAAYRFAEVALGEFKSQLSDARFPAEVSYSIDIHKQNYSSSQQLEGYHSPTKSDGRRILLKFNSQAPAHAQVGTDFFLYVSKNEREEAELMLSSPHGYDSFGARVESVYPKQSHAFDMRLKFWIDGIIRQMVNSLQEKAQETLRSSGYS